MMDGVVGGFGLANMANTDGASRRPERFPRETRNAGNAAASPGKASLDAFVAATGAEAVSLVGRAALALGNAVVDGIEGTADFVQHAAKQADRIASKAASPTPGGAARSGAAPKVSLKGTPRPRRGERAVAVTTRGSSGWGKPARRSRKPGSGAGSARRPRRRPENRRPRRRPPATPATSGGGRRARPPRTSSVARCPPRWRTSAASWTRRVLRLRLCVRNCGARARRSPPPRMRRRA